MDPELIRRVHYNNNQALRVAVCNGHDTIVLLLLERGANLYAAYSGFKSTILRGGCSRCQKMWFTLGDFAAVL